MPPPSASSLLRLSRHYSGRPLLITVTLMNREVPGEVLHIKRLSLSSTVGKFQKYEIHHPAQPFDRHYLYLQ